MGNTRSTTSSSINIHPQGHRAGSHHKDHLKMVRTRNNTRTTDPSKGGKSVLKEGGKPEIFLFSLLFSSPLLFSFSDGCLFHRAFVLTTLSSFLFFISPFSRGVLFVVV